MDDSLKSTFQRFLPRGRQSKNKPSWPAPENSTGDIYKSVHFGGKKCWDAKGPAREQFQLLALEIKEYLETHSDPVPAPVTWTVYMIGATVQSSRPTLMFCSENKTSRTIVRNKVVESGILEKYPGFDTGACSREFQRFATDIQMNDRPPNSGDLFVFYNRLDVGSGMHVYMKKNEKDAYPYRKARCGGIIDHDGKYFIHTVAHLFDDCSNTMLIQNSKELEAFEFELDDDSEDDVEDEDIAISNRGSATPEPGVNSRSSSSDRSASSKNFVLGNISQATSVYSFNLNVELDEETCEEPSSGSNAPFHPKLFGVDPSATLSRLNGSIILSTDGPQPGLDYCLIEIPSVELSFFRDFLSGTDCPTSIGSSSSDVEVCLIRDDAALKGKLSGTPSFMMLPGSRSVQEVWVFRHPGNLLQGDCGAWVIDTTTGILYGHLVAGNLQLGIGYVMPIHLVFNDIRSRFVGRWDLACRTKELDLCDEILSLPNATLPIPASSANPSDQNPQIFQHQHGVGSPDKEGITPPSGPRENNIDSASMIFQPSYIQPMLTSGMARTQSAPSAHVSQVNIATRFTCGHMGCTISFTRRQDMERHKAEFHSMAKQCPWCNYTTKRDQRMLEHIDDNHRPRKHKRPQDENLTAREQQPYEESGSQSAAKPPRQQTPQQYFANLRATSRPGQNF